MITTCVWWLNLITNRHIFSAPGLSLHPLPCFWLSGKWALARVVLPETCFYCKCLLNRNQIVKTWPCRVAWSKTFQPSSYILIDWGPLGHLRKSFFPFLNQIHLVFSHICTCLCPPSELTMILTSFDLCFCCVCFCTHVKCGMLITCIIHYRLE